MSRIPLPQTLALVLATAAAASPASAQQPLEEFLSAAEGSALDIREANAAVRQAQSQVDMARARLLPSLTAQGGYTRNEFEASLTIPGTSMQVTIQPFDSLSLQVQLAVPILDIGAWSSFFQSEAQAEAVSAQADNSALAVQASVIQIWFQLVASHAMREAAETTLAATERNLASAEARLELGAAAPLEVSRARAEVARATQAVAEAQLQVTLAARNLENLTGLAPTSRPRPLDVDVDAEPESLASYLSGTAQLPAMRAARSQQRAARIANDTAWTAFLPIVRGTATEIGSNVGGFTGQNFAYAIGLTATWTLDFMRPAQVEAAAAGADLANVRAERLEQQAETGIFEAWHRIQASRAAAHAAQAAVEASARAVQDVQASFDLGAATQLDLIQAQRDAFQSQVGLIQALANLEIARQVLRIRSGR